MFGDAGEHVGRVRQLGEILIGETRAPSAPPVIAVATASTGDILTRHSVAMWQRADGLRMRERGEDRGDTKVVQY